MDCPDLDKLLKGVLDWWSPSDMGLGEIIDRLQHLAACRSISVKIANGAENPDENQKYNAHRVLHLDRDAIHRMRLRGLTYRQIAETLGCSVGAVHNYATDKKNSRMDVIRKGAE